MEFQKEPGRVFALDEAGKLLAEVTFPTGPDGTADIDHTFVDPAFRGQGVASELLRTAADILRARGQKTRLTCSYAVEWFQRHPEYKDLLVEEG